MNNSFTYISVQKVLHNLWSSDTNVHSAWQKQKESLPFAAPSHFGGSLIHTNVISYGFNSTLL